MFQQICQCSKITTHEGLRSWLNHLTCHRQQQLAGTGEGRVHLDIGPPSHPHVSEKAPASPDSSYARTDTFSQGIYGAPICGSVSRIALFMLCFFSPKLINTDAKHGLIKHCSSAYPQFIVICHTLVTQCSPLPSPGRCELFSRPQRGSDLLHFDPVTQEQSLTRIFVLLTFSNCTSLSLLGHHDLATDLSLTTTTTTMSNCLPLPVALGVLMIDAVIEVGFIGSMIGFLHDRAGEFFTIYDNGTGPFDLHGKPENLLVNQGHTSNGAAGTALILVGVLGFLAISYDKRRFRGECLPVQCDDQEDRNLTAVQTQATKHSGIFVFWVVMSVLSAMLTLAALIYTFVLCAQSDNQSIDVTVAAAYPEPKMYPLDNWTPDNWFAAVLDLPLAHDSDRRTIRNHLRLIRGWKFNLISLFMLGLVVAALAMWDLMGGRRWRQGDSKEKFRYSTPPPHY